MKDKKSVIALVPEVYSSYIDSQVKSSMEQDSTLTEKKAREEAVKSYESNVVTTVSGSDSPFDDKMNTWLFSVKEDAVRYRLEHPEIALRKCAENLGISESALKTWMKSAKEHEGTVPTRGSGNYASDEAKEIARLQRELRDTKDALEVLKKAIGILGK